MGLVSWIMFGLVAVLYGGSFTRGLWHLNDDRRTARRRDFSHIVNRVSVGDLVLHHVMKLGPTLLIYGVAQAKPIPEGLDEVPYISAFFFALGLWPFGFPESMRLYINASTGLITLRPVFKPWSVFQYPDLEAKYLDDVQLSTRLTNGKLNLFGLETLPHHRHSRNEDLHRILSAYLSAFHRHDTDEARARRQQYRQDREARVQPRRERREARRLAAKKLKTEQRDRERAEKAQKAREAQAQIEGTDARMDQKFSGEVGNLSLQEKADDSGKLSVTDESE